MEAALLAVGAESPQRFVAECDRAWGDAYLGALFRGYRPNTGDDLRSDFFQRPMVATDERIVTAGEVFPDHAMASQRLMAVCAAHAPYRINRDVRTWPRLESPNLDGNAIYGKVVVVRMRQSTKRSIATFACAADTHALKVIVEVA
ncbi:hypothetical protein NA66_1009173 [Burkholderia pyrrocinia]|uniref:Uncharacterized protein n=1 Tax=Burkholderia pyrrocinia TaxID=60550 RepID=A0A318IPQ2_BURPY|nr:MULTISPECIES: hypothetical protein [Burkholderia]PXX33910.1 hypothetical protein NA66_1009173 [Burkholderia pyrrocinia]SFW65165.1 hypothetical protein SAMN03159384_03563 [Burkholderia sp. NFACC33-1]SFY21374.1 hypothetical protein SAMN03159408_03606 [Burkholderia sp. NFPP32]